MTATAHSPGPGIEVQPGLALYLGWGAMVLGMFMAILDIQIVASSLSQIQAGLSVSPDQVAWIQTAYLVAEIVMIPLSGYLARWLSTRVMFLVSAIGFTLFSLGCAFAWSFGSIVVLRGLQGFIGGGMIPCVFASIYKVFPREKHALANVIVGLIVTMAPLAGPTLGGLVTDDFGWRWLFLVNLPPGILVITLVWLMPAIDRGDASLSRGFDYLGLLMMALFLGGLEFVLDEGPRKDWLEDDMIRLWMMIVPVAATVFLWRSFRRANPIVDFRVFRNRNFTMGSLLAFCLGIGLFGSGYTIPLFLARVRELSPYQIGMVMSVSGIFMMVSAPVVGKLSEMMDRRIVIAVGLVLVAAGLLLNAQLNNQSQFHELFLPQALRGMGLICVIVNANTLSLGSLPIAEISNGSSVYNLMRNTGGAMGLAVINTELISRTHFHHERLAAWINPSRPEFQAFIQQLPLQLREGFVIGDTATMRMIEGIVSREATVMAFNDVHVLMAAAFVAALLLLPAIRNAAPGAAVQAH